MKKKENKIWLGKYVFPLGWRLYKSTMSYGHLYLLVVKEWEDTVVIASPSFNDSYIVKKSRLKIYELE